MDPFYTFFVMLMHAFWNFTAVVFVLFFFIKSKTGLEKFTFT